MLILICGLPGTGKTVLSTKLGDKINAVHLNTDLIRKRFLEKPTYSEKEKRLIYDRMFEIADLALKQGKHVILDGTFYKEALRKKAIAIAKSNKEKYLIVECKISEEKAKEWLSKRKKIKSVSDADYEIYKKLKNVFEPIKERHLVFRADKNFPNQFTKLLACIEKMKHN